MSGQHVVLRSGDAELKRIEARRLVAMSEDAELVRALWWVRSRSDADSVAGLVEGSARLGLVQSIRQWMAQCRPGSCRRRRHRDGAPGVVGDDKLL
jgi:hypothetical protein